MNGQFIPLPNGTILQNRYEIISLLGKGGMGAVYQAKHLHLKTEVAIKQTMLVGDDDFITAFKREASLLANLNHEAIPKVTDFFDENKGHFIVMELVDGEDLGDKLNRLQQIGKKRIPFSEIFDITIKLLDVLDYLHSRNVIHKDIKPSNLKITAAGKLKLLDFGLAKGSAGFMTHHLSSFLKGATPDYAPPEQLSFERTDQRSDLFSVAATIYHLLTGEVPPNPLTQRAFRLADGEPDPLRLVSELNAEVPKEIAEILQKAMSLNPLKRFESAQEMRRALMKFAPPSGTPKLSPSEFFPRIETEFFQRVDQKSVETELKSLEVTEIADNDLRETLAPSKTIVGIDIGTNYIRASFFAHGKPQIFQASYDDKSLPAVMAYSAEQGWLFGSKANTQLITNPQNSFSSINRLLGADYKNVSAKKYFLSQEILPDENGEIKIVSPLTGERFAPEQLLAKLLEKIKKDVSKQLGAYIINVVATCPNTASTKYRLKLKEACRLAGLNLLRIVNNASASALAFGLNPERDETVLIFDFGGGTLDVSVVEVGYGVVEIRSTNSNLNLGGNDIDASITGWLIDEFKRKQGIDLTADKTAVQRLKEAAEKAKIELSSATESEINLPFITANQTGPKHLAVRLTRAKLESLIEPILKSALPTVERALKDAGIAPKVIDNVILAGGSTRIPKVRQFVKSILGKEPNKTVNPDEVVALGTAVQAGILGGEKTDLMLLDVTPLSLSIETSGGVMTQMIARNTTIPTRKSEVFAVSSDTQSQVLIHVLEGESDVAAANRSLAISLVNVRSFAASKPPEFEIVLDIDANGALRVEVKDFNSGNKYETIIIDNESLSQIPNKANLLTEKHLLPVLN